MAAATDKWRKKKSYFSTTLNGSIGASDTTIALSSASGLPTDTAITLSIDRVDANGLSTASARERVTGVISGSNLTVALRGEDGDSGTGKAHSSGAVVEDVWEADTWNDAVDSFLAEHNQAGTHKFTTVLDSNSNESLKLGVTASAVNEVTITNAATGNAPIISATGGDTNIPLLLVGKGTGKIRIADAVTTTKILTFELVGATAAKTMTLAISHTNDRTLTLPDATDTLVGKATTDTLTNKRKQPRVYSAANNASLTPEIDTYDIFHLTAMSAATTINNPSTSTPADGEMMLFRFLDNGTARALTWGTAYVAKAGTALPTTTTVSKNLSCLFQYNSNLAKWNLLASGLET